MLRDDRSLQLQTIATQILRHAHHEGEIETVVPGFTLFRAAAPTTVRSGILKPSCCIVVQGGKVAQAAGTELRYRAGSFVTTAIDLPIAGQVVEASRAEPYLAARFEMTAHDVLEVVTEADLQIDVDAPRTPAAFVGTCDAHLLDVVLRAVSSLDDARGAKFFAPLLRKELVYRLVTGPNAAAFCQSAALARPDDGVGRAVEWINAHFREPLRIDELARRAKMSTSSLQHKFKATVMMGPLQYQKRLRLEEARRLLLDGQSDATRAAFDVGYESPSQFNREYRRQFGLPPLRDLKRLRDEIRVG